VSPFRSGLTSEDRQDSCRERRCREGNGTADRNGRTGEGTIGPFDCLRQRADSDDCDYDQCPERDSDSSHSSYPRWDAGVVRASMIVSATSTAMIRPAMVIATGRLRHPRFGLRSTNGRANSKPNSTPVP
jgi:hypothetical protein